MYLKVVSRAAFIIVIPFIITCCAGSVASRKERAQVQEDMGRSLVVNGKPRDGLVYLLESEKLNPSNPEIHYNLALAYREIDEYELSLQHFKKAIVLKPKYPEAYNDMGILYSQKKDWDNALDCFKKAAAEILYSTPHYAYHNMGSVYFHKSDYDKAIENYEKAIKLSPTHVAAYQDLAILYESIDQQDKALAIYKTAVSIAPQAWGIQLNLSRLYLKMGLKQQAIKQLNYIITTDPRSQYAKDAVKLLGSIQRPE